MALRMVHVRILDSGLEQIMKCKDFSVLNRLLQVTTQVIKLAFSDTHTHTHHDLEDGSCVKRFSAVKGGVVITLNSIAEYGLYASILIDDLLIWLCKKC